MKRIRFLVMPLCMILLCLTACAQTPTTDLPTLTVGGTLEAKTGARSWNVKQGFGKWMCQEASVVFPLDCPDDYPALTLPQDGVITLQWDTPPDTYSVSYWEEDVWDDGMEAVQTEGQEHDAGFRMPEEDTPAIVTIRAVWEKQVLCSSYGEVEYIFKIAPEQ